jgi:hypothetical protein
VEDRTPFDQTNTFEVNHRASILAETRSAD